jgi:hypothetical protein
MEDDWKRAGPPGPLLSFPGWHRRSERGYLERWLPRGHLERQAYPTALILDTDSRFLRTARTATSGIERRYTPDLAENPKSSVGSTSMGA